MADLIADLERVLGDGSVLSGAEVSARQASYWDPSPLQALALVRPVSTKEVGLVLRMCHARGQPVVTHGGLTGCCAGDKSTSGDLVLSLERMNRVEEIDPIGRTVVVQAGCPLQVLQQSVDAAGLLFPLDLGARGSATIGGNVATNAGGVNVIRYGMIRSLILGLEAVLADGTVISSMNRMLKNNTGYDLKQLFIGTEGTLGVVTRAVLSLRERPVSCNTALVALTDAELVARLLKHMDQSLGGTLSAYEVMWGDYFKAVTAPGGHRAPLSRDYPFYVLIEAHGADQALDEQHFHAALEQAFEQQLVVDAVIPKSRAERDQVWTIREDFEALLSDRPQFLYDVSLPIRHMPAYVDAVRGRLSAQWPNHRFHALGHIGDGNLHFFISPGSDGDGLHEMADAAVYEPLQQFGGAVSAEHGIGLEKKPYLPLSRSAAEIELMRTLKRALDPRNILNPGKIIDL